VPFRQRVSDPAAGIFEVRHDAAPLRISFDRAELAVILSVYGTKVADGEWRDYAIDAGSEKAVFSVFRRAADTPLYQIEKNPRLARRQGAYAVIAQGGATLRRGHDLAQVLRILFRRPKLVMI
jgi:hypothetical protein